MLTQGGGNSMSSNSSISNFFGRKSIHSEKVSKILKWFCLQPHGRTHNCTRHFLAASHCISVGLGNTGHTEGKLKFSAPCKSRGCFMQSCCLQEKKHRAKNIIIRKLFEVSAWGKRWGLFKRLRGNEGRGKFQVGLRRCTSWLMEKPFPAIADWEMRMLKETPENNKSVSGAGPERVHSCHGGQGRWSLLLHGLFFFCSFYPSWKVINNISAINVKTTNLIQGKWFKILGG